MDAEPSMEDVAAEWPGWHCWTGIAGMRYGRLVGSSPPVVVRAEDALDLRDQIRAVEGNRDDYGRLPRGVTTWY